MLVTLSADPSTVILMIVGQRPTTLAVCAG